MVRVNTEVKLNNFLDYSEKEMDLYHNPKFKDENRK